MTLIEAVAQNPTLINTPVEAIMLLFTARGYEYTDDYTSSNVKQLELITADAYLEIASTPDITEGGLTLKYNKSILMNRARQIYLKYGDDKLPLTEGRKLNLNITKR